MVLSVFAVFLCLLRSFGSAQRILEGPDNSVAFLNHSAVFTCESDGGIASWRVNGTILQALPPDIERDMELNISYTDTGTKFERLIVPARANYNQTVIRCVVFDIDNSRVESENKTMLIQGPLSAVGDLTASYSSSSVTVRWTAPFSLDVTGVDHDIWYSVIIYNVTDENNSTVINCTDCINITNTYYIFTPNSPGLCHQYIFSVLPLNGAGIGASSNYTSFLHNKTVITDVRLFKNITISKQSSAEYQILLTTPPFNKQDTVLCYLSEVQLRYESTQKYCPSVVADDSPHLISENEWLIVSEVNLRENCDYTLHLLTSHNGAGDTNSNITLSFSTTVVIVEVKEEEGEVEVKCVFRQTLSDSCYVQLVSEVEGGFHQGDCVKGEEEGDGIVKFPNLLPATYTILVNGLSGENMSCSSGGGTPDYITVITISQSKSVSSHPSNTVDIMRPLADIRKTTPLCAEGIGIGVCLGVVSTCLLFMFGMITIKVVVKMKRKKDGKTPTASAQKMAMDRNMAYELHKPPSLRRGPATSTTPSSTQNPVYEDLK